jgi:hypothetical protein
MLILKCNVIACKGEKMAVGGGMCGDITCGLSFHCLLLTSYEGICMLQICVQDSAKLWTMPAIAEITHQQFLHGWWFYEAKVPRIYGGCCPFWEAVCKGHSSGTHLSVLKVHVHLKHMIQGALAEACFDKEEILISWEDLILSWE